MKITGKNLRLVSYALSLSLDEIHNMIATCPDVNEFAEDIAEYKRDRAKIERFKARVDQAIAKEQQR